MDTGLPLDYESICALLTGGEPVRGRLSCIVFAEWSPAVWPGLAGVIKSRPAGHCLSRCAAPLLPCCSSPYLVPLQVPVPPQLAIPGPGLKLLLLPLLSWFAACTLSMSSVM